MGKFQTLGSVHGHHGHAVVAVGLAVQIGVQRHLVQKARQRRLTLRVFQIALDAGFQLLHVLQTAAALYIVLFPQGGGVAALVADQIVERHEVGVRQLPAQGLDHVCKGEKLASCIFQFRIVSRVKKHLIEGASLLGGKDLCLVHGGLSDLAGGYVDDAPQTQVIGSVADDAQIRQHILDLGAVEELHAAVDLVGYAVALERIFQRVGLGVHPVEHRVVLPAFAPAVAGHHLPHHIIGLVALIKGGLDGDLLPRPVLCPQGLSLAPLVVADDGVGRVQNVLRGAVILLQPDGAGALVLLFKAENVADVRAAETVNALVVVAHHADIVPFVGQKAGQQVLQVVGVLILVDEDITEFVLVVRPHIRAVLQQPDGVQDDVVEVQRIGVPQLSVVKCIDFTDPDAPPIVDGLPLLNKRLRRLHIVLCTGNNAQDLSGWKRLLVQRQLLEDVFNDPLAVVRIVDGEAAVKAETVDVPAQDTDTGGVERGRPHVLRHILPQHTAQPLLQLVGGLIGKGDGQHLPRAGGLHGAEVLHQRTLLLVGRFGVFLQKRRHVLRHGDGDIRTVAAPPVAQQIGHAVDKHRGLAGSSFPSYRASSSTRQPLADHSSACGKNRSFSGQAASRISGAPSRYVSSSWNDTPPYFFAELNGMAARAV